MSDLILHHYALSPFSEKVRAMLGYTGLSWQSVTTDEMPPRPMLAPLAGGYRKIPVAQIGADVFCDTRTITREIARLAGKPELALEGVDDEVRAFVAETDLTLFMAVMMSSVGLRVNIKLFRAMPFGQLLRFFKDRIHIGRTSNVPRMSLKEARAKTREHLADMEARLQGKDWLFGDKPCIADFSAYHALWFLREVAESKTLKDFPAVLAWMDRIKAFGHGESAPLSQEAALDKARQSAPLALPESTLTPALLGKTVQVAPTDYGQVPSKGELVFQGDNRIVLALANAGGSTVHVHFPEAGFAVQSA
ncbi:glutathione S-transferase family protein [Alcanivorax sp. S6407]|uniref:glutathione S-transferase family protein n=1 Tax=Alcanivorax sp. S6407 TaxID=2926424 RepID=UPI001FF4AC00|nr:glutathione S-transferase family protein [Alcanivorax sp. S6407]MCK0155149.1 glutathione S-transferase family protein [Alcanivorax sp. S6407]